MGLFWGRGCILDVVLEHGHGAHTRSAAPQEQPETSTPLLRFCDGMERGGWASAAEKDGERALGVAQIVRSFSGDGDIVDKFLLLGGRQPTFELLE